jgi:hypothetical protein
MWVTYMLACAAVCFALDNVRHQAKTLRRASNGQRRISTATQQEVSGSNEDSCRVTGAIRAGKHSLSETAGRCTYIYVGVWLGMHGHPS